MALSQFVTSFARPGVLVGDFNGPAAAADFDPVVPPADAATVIDPAPPAVGVEAPLVDLWLATPRAARFFGYTMARPGTGRPAAPSAAGSSASSPTASAALPDGTARVVTAPPLPGGMSDAVSAPPLDSPAADAAVALAAAARDADPLPGLSDEDALLLENGWTFNAWAPKSRIDYVFSWSPRPAAAADAAADADAEDAPALCALEMRLTGVDSVPATSLGLTGSEKAAGVELNGHMFPSDHRFLLAVVATASPAAAPVSDA